MKKFLLVLSFILFSFSSSSFAFLRSGGSLDRVLKCETVEDTTLKREVKLVVITAATAPEFSVRGVSVHVKAIAPHAKATISSLKQISQSVYDAIFTSVVTTTTVYLDKSNFVADLYLDNINYLCK